MKTHPSIPRILLLCVACTTIAVARISASDPDIVEGTESWFAPIPIFFTAAGSIPPDLVVPVEFVSLQPREINGSPLVPLITIQHAYSANCDLDLAPRIPGGSTTFAADAFDPGQGVGEIWFFGGELRNTRNDPLLEGDMNAFKEEDHNYTGVPDGYDPPSGPCVVLTCNVGARMLTGWPNPDNIASAGDPLPPAAAETMVVASNAASLCLVTGPLAMFWKEGQKSPYEAWLDHYGLTGDDRLPTNDPDGDNATNQEEFDAGTDPTSFSDFPQPLQLASVTGIDGSIQFSWVTRAGRTYEVLHANRVDAPSAGWTVVSTISGMGNGETATYQGVPPAGTAPAFYRVRSH
ncbi:MAG TPA: hypothetical protein PKM73_04640 [Verrucomicrobiota bacterium]|nr:hypothetical protein [Verrucomicrobiota bacterium]HNU50625.1 hypothetical protein [Verrucomicrobiota bacterium]